MFEGFDKLKEDYIKGIDYSLCTEQLHNLAVEWFNAAEAWAGGLFMMPADRTASENALSFLESVIATHYKYRAGDIRPTRYAYSDLQRLASRCCPVGDIAEVREKFESLDLPVHGFPEFGQKAPLNTGSASAHDLVIEDMKKRKAFGLEKYGTCLTSDNGRDHLKDAYEECLDMLVYLKCAMEQRDAMQGVQTPSSDA